MMRFIAVLASGLIAASAALAAPERPRDLVLSQAERVLSALVERRDEFRANPATLEAYVLGELQGSFDEEYSARLVLGRHSRGVPDAKIHAFADALTTNLMRRYGKAMLEFDANVKVRVLSELSRVSRRRPLEMTVYGRSTVAIISEVARSFG